MNLIILLRGHGGAMVTHSTPTQVGGSTSNPGPYVGQLVASYQCSAVYSTEFCPTVCMTYTVLKATQINILLFSNHLF